MSEKFPAYPKTPRFNMGCIVTEKIDGTNALIQFTDSALDNDPAPVVAHVVDATNRSVAVRAGSRKRWITPEKDNFGFAAFVRDHAQELFDLCGMGLHYGEWWGLGIQRGYAQNGKRLSLFDGPGRYPGVVDEQALRDAQEVLGNAEVHQHPLPTRDIVMGDVRVNVVPLLYQGPFDGVIMTLHTSGEQGLRNRFLPEGSKAAPGYAGTEGVVVSLRGSGGGQRFKIVWDKG